MSSQYSDRLGVATLSLGSCQHHSLPVRLREAAKVGFKVIDLFDDDWAEYLASNGLDPEALWEPTEENLRVAQQLGDLVKSLGMTIGVTQPLKEIEGVTDPRERQASIDRTVRRFPFMRAWDTDLVFMCANIRTDPGVVTDFKTVARDLAELGDLAAEYSRRDGGRMIKIGYEAISWSRRNTWASVYEVVRAANRPNVGLILDTFNLLAVEYADPYNPAGHGRIYPTVEESLDVLCASLASLVATVPGDKIFFVQIADAELMDPKQFIKPTDTRIPALLPWSRRHRQFPMEIHEKGYMPVELALAAILATGYDGPLSLEVFNHFFHEPHQSVPAISAQRGYRGLVKLLEVVRRVPKFWGESAPSGHTKYSKQILENLTPDSTVRRENRNAPVRSNL